MGNNWREIQIEITLLCVPRPSSGGAVLRLKPLDGRCQIQSPVGLAELARSFPRFLRNSRKYELCFLRKTPRGAPALHVQVPQANKRLNPITHLWVTLRVDCETVARSLLCLSNKKFDLFYISLNLRMKLEKILLIIFQNKSFSEFIDDCSKDLSGIFL